MFQASVEARSSSSRFRGGHGWYFRLPVGDGNGAGWIYQTSVWLVEVGVQVCWFWRSATLSAETGRALIWQSVFPRRQTVLKLETLVQSSSHDFGEHLEMDVLVVEDFCMSIVYVSKLNSSECMKGVCVGITMVWHFQVKRAVFTTRQKNWDSSVCCSSATWRCFFTGTWFTELRDFCHLF